MFKRKLKKTQKNKYSFIRYYTKNFIASCVIILMYLCVLTVYTIMHKNDHHIYQDRFNHILPFTLYINYRRPHCRK